MRLLIAVLLVVILVLGMVSSVEAATKANKKEVLFPNFLKKPQTAADAKKNTIEREKILAEIRKNKILSNKTDVVSIRLDNTCIQNIKFNLKSNCPSYQILSRFDTTDQRKAGQFVFDTYYHRAKSPFNWIEQLDAKKTVICVDCITEKPIAFKHHITIVNRLYFPVGTQMIDNTIVFTKNRYIDPNCQDAVLVYSYQLLRDTINYLQSGCTIEKMIDTESQKQELLRIHYDDPGFSYQKWLTEAKKLKTINCIKSIAC